MFSTVRGIKQYPNLGEINRLCVYLYYHSKSTYSVNWTSLIKQWTQLDSHKTMPIHRCDGTVTTKWGRGDLYKIRPASQSTGAKWLQITSVIISTNIQQDGNIIYCKMHQHISHLHISHSNNLKYWRAFWLPWICTNILQSCMHRISRWITLSSFSINIENMNYFTHDQEQKVKTFCYSQVWLWDRVRWPSKCPSIITQSDSISIRSPSIFFLP